MRVGPALLGRGQMSTVPECWRKAECLLMPRISCICRHLEEIAASAASAADRKRLFRFPPMPSSIAF